MAMDQMETFEWLRERSVRLDEVTRERDDARAELAATETRYRQKKDLLEALCLDVGRWGIELAITARERDAAQAENERLRDALEEIKRNGSALCSRAPIIAAAVLAPNPFGQQECVCGWANNDLRATCRNCGAALVTPASTDRAAAQEVNRDCH